MGNTTLSWGALKNCSPTKTTRKLKLWLVFAYIIALFCLPARSVFSQTTGGPEPKSWLPRTLNQSLQESLSKAVDHVSTREGCINVLEAKVSESRDQINPKFIVTCSSMDNTTLNFVYWQSDIENNFRGITYPEKQEKQEKQIFSVAEQQRLKLLELRDKNRDLISSCQTHLASKLSDKAPYYCESDVIISQRGEQLPVVYIEYSADQSEFSPLYTATCRHDINQSIKMTIFPRRRP